MRLLVKPTTPFPVDASASVHDTILRMADTGFQGRNLGRALQVWERMHDAGAFVFLGISGALIPARDARSYFLVDSEWLCALRGLHRCPASMISMKPSASKTTGRSCRTNDTLLREHRIDRMYDIYASEIEFQSIDQSVANRAADQVYTSETILRTPEFFVTLARAARERGVVVEGVVTTAERMGVPIFSPALGDDSIGLALAFRQARNPSRRAVRYHWQRDGRGRPGGKASQTGVVSGRWYAQKLHPGRQKSR